MERPKIKKREMKIKKEKLGKYIGMIRDRLNENARGSSLKNYIFFPFWHDS